MVSRSVAAGIAVSGVLLLFAVAFLFQTRDPMVLVFAVWPIALLWVVLLVVHVMRRGIPVRIVSDERKER